jgi:hypothetical protein
MLPPHDVDRHRDIGACLKEAEAIKMDEHRQGFFVQLTKLLPLPLQI